MVEPPSAMYVQSRGSVWDRGVLVSDDEARAEGTTVCDLSADSFGFTLPEFRDIA